MAICKIVLPSQHKLNPPFIHHYSLFYFSYIQIWLKIQHTSNQWLVYSVVPDTQQLYKVYVALPPHGREAVLPPQLDTEVKVMGRVSAAGDIQIPPLFQGILCVCLHRRQLYRCVLSVPVYASVCVLGETFAAVAGLASRASLSLE